MDLFVALKRAMFLGALVLVGPLRVAEDAFCLLGKVFGESERSSDLILALLHQIYIVG